MRPMFTEEVARYLGYQKYWPEWQDWVIGTIVCWVGGSIIVGLLVLAVNQIK